MKEARLQNPVLTNRNRILRRAFVLDKVARHTEVRNLSDSRLRRCGSDRRKVNIITRGGLIDHELIKVRSQQKS